MASERMDFADIGKFDSETNLTNGKGRKSGGCHCSTAVGFLLVLLAIAIAVGVGLIVHFAGSRQVVCKCPGGQQGTVAPANPSTDALRQECKKMAMDGSKEICSACKADWPMSTTRKPGVTTMRPTAMSTAMSTAMATTAAPTKAPKVKDVRLPRSLNPMYYDVELRPNMYEGDPSAFTFDGYTNIRIKCLEATDNITIHMNKLTIAEGTMALSPAPGTASAPQITSWSEDKARQFLVINLSSQLVKDGQYDLRMNFTGPLKGDLHGLYLSQYKRGNDTIYAATTQFQPTDARKAFPCFDEPAIKSEFNIVLVRKSHLKALSNMPIIYSQDRGDNWIADVFEKTPKMSTYLLAFIVCDFNYTMNVTKYNVTYRAWARPDSVDQTKYALSVGVPVLTYFEDYFDIKFPLPKQDMIAIPDFAAGAMENWGLITYRETAMLYQPGVSSEGNKQRVAVVISHELAHQWFGDLVTPSWWDDLWLNEGFASFVEYMGVDYVHPDWKMFEQFVISALQPVFDFDGLVSSHPVYVPVGHPDEINEIFDSISYNKGASIIRMMRFFLGEGTFQRGLTRYLNSKRLAAAFHDDLWAALAEQSRVEGKQRDVKSIMDSWTLQMNYPVVTVVREGDTRLRLNQTRFLRDPTAPDPGRYTSPFGYRWDIPFTVTSSQELDFNKTDADITWYWKRGTGDLVIEKANVFPPASDTNGWILANVHQYGYYRVNYERSNWVALTNQLKTNHKVIPATNRAQIINDAWNLASAGMLDQLTALQTIEYLDKELDYIPRVAADRQLSYVDTMLSRSGLYGSFQKFMKDKIQDPFGQIGMDNTGAGHLESYVRSNVVSTACSYGNTNCSNSASKLFRQWMTSPENNPIDPGLKGTVYCTAIKSGGVEEWDFAFRQYETATVASEASKLLSAMSCADEPWILGRYLDWALTPSKIRKQDGLNTIGYVARNSVGRGLAWDFVRRRWSTIRTEYGGSFFAFSRLIGRITEAFNTQFDLEQLQSFMATHPDMGSGTRAFDQAVEKTKANIKWMDKNFKTVQKWLMDLGY